MLLPIVLSLFLSAFPSNSTSSWMQPEAFHLRLNMPKGEVLKALKQRGWRVEKGKQVTQQVLQYDDRKTVTMMFINDRLHSMRFEMIDFFPAVQSGFKEQKATLSKSLGTPSAHFSTDKILVFDKRRPNVHVVLTTDPASDMGKQGIGMLVVRYFDPAGGA